MLICAWCLKEVKLGSEVIGFERHTQIVYRNGVETVEGPQQTETHYFCTREHRHEYLYGL